jgi:hypothetical protein
MPQVAQLVASLQPKRIISPYDLNTTRPENACVVETIARGQTRTVSEADLGNIKYKGVCPTSIASVIRMQSASDGRMMSRITDLQIEFKDDKYQVKRIGEPAPATSEN